MTDRVVTCLLLFGDQAELELAGEEGARAARWPAALIAADTGLSVDELPGRRFLVSVTGGKAAPVFCGFRLAGGHPK